MKTTVKRKSTAGKSKKSKNTKIGSFGKRIMAKAKLIRKANPRKKWTTCVSEAAKKL